MNVKPVLNIDAWLFEMDAENRVKSESNFNVYSRTFNKRLCLLNITPLSGSLFCLLLLKQLTSVK